MPSGKLPSFRVLLGINISFMMNSTMSPLSFRSKSFRYITSFANSARSFFCSEALSLFIILSKYLIAMRIFPVSVFTSDPFRIRPSCVASYILSLANLLTPKAAL